MIFNKGMKKYSARKAGLGSVLIWAVTTALAGLFLNIIFGLTGMFALSEGFADAVSKQYSVDLGTGILLFGIIAPVLEELVFRKVFFRILRHRITFLPAAFASALCFAAYHGNIVQGSYSFIIGFLICAGYEKTGFFLTAAASHSLTNMLVYLLTRQELFPYSIYSLKGLLISGILLTAAVPGLLFLLRERKHSFDKK